MPVLLLCLMSCQLTGEEKHEWTGILMTLSVIVCQILNRRWYAALFKGKYNTCRSVTTAVNLLLPAFACGVCLHRLSLRTCVYAAGLTCAACLRMAQLFRRAAIIYIS